MEKNTIVFVPESEQIGLIFEHFMDNVCDYPYHRHHNNFYFNVPNNMELDEFNSYLDGLLKHQDDIKGDWTAVMCESPEEILMDFGNFSADMDQYGVYFIPGQISRHEEYHDDDENDLQGEQVQREENMTLRILHDVPDAIQLLRKTLTEDISENHKKDFENLLKGMGLQVE